MMSGELWPPHAISRLPSKAAPTLGSAPVLPAAHGTQPPSLKLVADTCLAKLTGSAARRSYFPIEDLAAICVEEEEAGYDRGRQ